MNTLRNILLAMGLALLAFMSQAQTPEHRVALVIGNAAYKGNPLKNPVNDAVDVAASLRGYGFTVVERTNLTTKQVGPTLREFRSKLSPGSVAVVFYAGHGVQIKGENYLPAVDAEIAGEEDVPMQSLSTRQIMDILAESKTRMNLVFLDACRDNPYARSFRSGSRGLTKENAPSGTLISFATRPGGVAADGDGRNGLYTSVLLQQMKLADQPIEQVLKRVVAGVKAASKGRQEPWMEGSIEGDFYFGAANPRPAQAAAITAPPKSEGLALDDLRQQQELRQRWTTWQASMKADFEKVAALQAEPDLLVTAWDRFLDNYKLKNPFSDDDERLRADARARKLAAESDQRRRLSASSKPNAVTGSTALPATSAGHLNAMMEAELRRLGR